MQFIFRYVGRFPVSFLGHIKPINTTIKKDWKEIPVPPIVNSITFSEPSKAEPQLLLHPRDRNLKQMKNSSINFFKFFKRNIPVITSKYGTVLYNISETTQQHLPVILYITVMKS
jgi:hypothetical protein